VRARREATVATPLDWSEVADSRLRPQRFTVEIVRKRIDQDGDPWRGSARPRSLSRPQLRLVQLWEAEAAKVTRG
jgi:DNA primase